MGRIKEKDCMAGITARLSPSGVISARMLSPSGVIRARMLSNHIRTQERAVVPQPQDQVILPDAGYDGFAKVVVKAIPNNWGEIIWDGAVMTVK